MTAMNFSLVRAGWPNIVPILALAAVPAFAMTTDRLPHPARTPSVTMTEVCPQTANGLQIAAGQILK